jgi:hypothetical protein
LILDPGMNSLIKRTTVVTSLALSCAAALAAGSLNGKVLSVDGGQVAVEINGQTPAWLTPGSTVQALGWQTRVATVDGNKIVLSMAPAKASKVKVASEVVVQEISKQERYGC